jgi:hypothetical protein
MILDILSILLAGYAITLMNPWQKKVVLYEFIAAVFTVVCLVSYMFYFMDADVEKQLLQQFEKDGNSTRYTLGFLKYWMKQLPG